MAANAKWTAFLELLEMDGQNNDEVGIAARTLVSSLTKYMELRFETDEITYFFDFVQSRAVMNAISQSLTNRKGDALAIKGAIVNAMPTDIVPPVA